jgi:hypothetical protein
MPHPFSNSSVACLVRISHRHVFYSEILRISSQYIHSRDAPVPPKKVDLPKPGPGGGTVAAQGGPGGHGREDGGGYGGGPAPTVAPAVAAPPKKVGPNFGDASVLEALKRRAEAASAAEQVCLV